MHNTPETLALDFDEVVNTFNFVAGVIYDDGENLYAPLMHGAKHYVADCVVFSRETRQEDLGEVDISPVRAEDLGRPIAWRPDIVVRAALLQGRGTDATPYVADFQAPKQGLRDRLIPASGEHTKKFSR